VKKQNNPLDAYILANLPLLSLLKSLLPYQLSLVLSQHDHETVLSTRRAGKTTGCLAALLYKCLKQPNSTTHYLAITRQSAKRIAWGELKKMCRDHNIQAEFQESELTACFPNGSKIYLAGINGEHLLDQLRGTPIDALVLDEAASYRGSVVQTLIEEVAEPALGDRNGRIMMVGTPGPIPHGFFFDATSSKKPEWNIRHWSVLNNTHFADGKAAEWLANHKAKKAWSDIHPVYQREYLGQWTLNSDALVYRFEASRNVGQPTHSLTHHVLGVDLGFKDATAFVVLGYNPEVSAKAYVVHTEAHSGWDITKIKTKIKELQAKYSPHHTIMDEGGLGKLIAEELRNRDHISCSPAEKTDKAGWIELLNGALLQGELVVTDPSSPLIGEWINLQWDQDNPGKEHDSYDNHCADACLYAFRKAYSYAYRPPAPKPLTEEDRVLAAFARMDALAIQRDQQEWWDDE